MNKIIKVIRIGTPDDIKTSIRRIVSQLEKHNYAICSDARAVRLISRFIPEPYKRNRTVIFSRTIDKVKPTKSIITINPEYRLEVKDTYSFKIRLKAK